MCHGRICANILDTPTVAIPPSKAQKWEHKLRESPEKQRVDEINIFCTNATDLGLLNEDSEKYDEDSEKYDT